MYGTKNTIPSALTPSEPIGMADGGSLYPLAKLLIPTVPTAPALPSLWDLPPITSLVPAAPFVRALTPPPAIAPAPVITRWHYVTRRFDRLINSLGVPQTRIDDGVRKQAGILRCLNRHYWGISSEYANSILIGSWAKSTIIGPSSDIDFLFLLPAEIYFNYEQRSGNKQSQLLQEVRAVLSDQGKYQNTEINGDRQVVVVKFESITVEILLAFTCDDGSLIICDTKHGGYYKAANPVAELADLAASDTKWNGNTRALALMGKKWLQIRNVKGLKAFMIERLAVEFIAAWRYNLQDRFWYDWMVRDFFYYLLGRVNSSISMPGTGEIVYIGNEWLTEATRAYQHAYTACIHEDANEDAKAGASWREIFGSAVPARIF